jgi:FPC/CPF motif-containing protein YcgG
MPVHPDIGFYGDPINREWKQYALPDDNEPEAGICPFHARTKNAHRSNNNHAYPRKA